MSHGYLHEDFFLEGATARRLYHDTARRLPIVDFHNHLPPRWIAEDRSFADLAEAWLADDHYKWRLMRANGVPEEFITGNADPWEKFQRFAATLHHAVGNPVHHWCHLELRRFLGITDTLNPKTAKAIWEAANERINDPALSCRGILKQSNVSVLCTTDDPTDNLEHHKTIAQDGAFDIAVYPTFRPDAAFFPEDPSRFCTMLEKLENGVGASIDSFDHLMQALEKRAAFFGEMGCRSSDHGLPHLEAEMGTLGEARIVFRNARSGSESMQGNISAYRAVLLHELGRLYHRLGWVMQLHLGPARNLSSRLYNGCGPDAGGDAIGGFEQAPGLAATLDRLDAEGALPRTILYNSNPRDSWMFATVAGSFHDGSFPGKVQYGPAWWFLDHEQGILEHLRIAAQSGLLGRFVGMTTDSRSFFSMARHEYFRRLLCRFLGEAADRGLIPASLDALEPSVRGICSKNPVDFFEFPLPPGTR